MLNFSPFVKKFRPFKNNLNWLSGALIIICFLIYIHSISFSYINLDDNILIEESLFYLKNPGNIFSVLNRGVFSSLGETKGIFYRPILSVSFIIDSFLSGNQPSFSRFMNIFLHGASAVLLFHFLFLITANELRSFFPALLFAVHPLAGAVVTWLPGRNDSLLLIFILTSFLFFILFLNKKNAVYFLLHAFFFLLSLLTKETAIAAPVLFLFYLISVVKKKFTPGITAGFILTWTFLTAVFFYLRSSAMLNSSSYITLEMLQNTAHQFPGLFVYFGKIFLPFQLSVYSELKDSAVWPGVIFFSLLIIYLFKSETKNAGLAVFGILWFVVFLLPTFTMLENYSDGVIREHRAYLPFIGVLLSVSAINPKIRRPILKVYYLIITVILTGLTYLSYHYSFNFKNEIAFWSNSVSVSPSSAVSYFQLGLAYTRESKYDEAEKAYRKAIGIRQVLPPGAYNNLGVLYLHKGKIEEASELFKKELEQHPNLDEARKNLNGLKD